MDRTKLWTSLPCGLLLLAGFSRPALAEDAPKAAASPAPAAAAEPGPQHRGTRLDRCRLTPPEELGTPPSAAVVAGWRTAYTPFVRFGIGHKCMMIEVPASVTATVGGTSSFPVDRYDNHFAPGVTVSPQLRLGARFSSGLQWKPIHVLAEYEQDLLTGVIAGSSGVDGIGLPAEQHLETQLRKLHARVALGHYVQLDAGVMTSHFGMGLLANDGDHGWTPGSARFNDPRGGDRVLRAQLSTGPHTDLGLVVAGGIDKPLGDDILLDGDSARQVFGALLLGVDKPTGGGFYIVGRHQQNAFARATDVSAYDVTFRTKVAFPGATLGFETEWALITGMTDLAPTVEYPQHRVLQIGGAARLGLDAGAYGTTIDFLFASGDQNPYDNKQNAFKVDPNYEMGLLLFRQVIAAQSGRAARTAGDPALVGVPADDLDRLPTRASVSNTIAIFPRLRYRPMPGLETYGGALLAMAAVPNIDVFNTQISGGEARSSLGGPASRFLGTELDVGIRYRALIYGSELMLGGELGALVPGSAFSALDRTTMGAVTGGRFILRYRL